MTEIIKAKRRGQSHSQAEIQTMIREFVAGRLPDYQMSAWMMAVCFQGMTAQETAWLTEAMTDSGRRLKFDGLPAKAVDKHSTGGVGDKVSLILAPLVAAAGLPVPMMAGRGLAHTGGTLDKLECIPGFSVSLSLEAFQKQVETFGLAVMGQTKEICPADMKLYALRDVTATVDCVPLICASIMSKKIAEGIGGLVLDVKYGSGAFMKTLPEARRLAMELQRVGRLNGLSVTAALTNMDQPLGRHVGNATEVLECIDILSGRSCMENGLDFYADLRELTLQLAAQMLVLGGLFTTAESAVGRARELLADGSALKKFLELCHRQGAKAGWAIAWPSPLHVVTAPKSGYIASMNCERIGVAAISLGAGRQKTDDKIDPRAGIEVMIKLGQRVELQQPLFRLFADPSRSIDAVGKELIEAVIIGDEAVAPPPLVAEILS